MTELSPHPLLSLPTRSRISPLAWTALVLAIAFCVNLATARLSPRVWIDEVMFTDPAFNLASGHGFTSSCWPCQRPGELFVGNMPLYELVLAGWIRLLGFGVVQVRSLNYVLVSLGIFFTLAGALRRGMIQSAIACILFSIGVLGGYWTSFSYRGARYDMLGFCLLAACWWAATIARPMWRYIAVIFIATLIPLSSIPPMIALIVLGGIGLVFSRFKELKAYIAAVAGSIAGSGIYFGALYHWGFLGVFLRTLPTMMARSPEFNAKIKSLTHALACDPSTQILIAAAILILLLAMVVQFEHRSTLLRWIAAALAFAILVPTAFIVAGRFPEYYAWTKHVPTLFCLIGALELLLIQPRPRLRLSAYLIVAAVLISAAPFALRLGFTIRAHSARDYALVEQAERPQLNPRDQVFCSYAYYYPARQLCAQVYVPVSVEWMTSDDWNHVTAAVLDAEDEAMFFQHQARGDWRLVSSFDPPASRAEASRYAYHLYRRAKS